MKNIRIEISSKKKTKVTSIDLPESWDEVPDEVYPALCSIYLKTPYEMNAYDKTVRAFALLTIDHYDVISQLTAEELYPLLNLIDWVFTRLDLKRNPLQKISVSGNDYFGPGAEMENLRFAEWCVAETYFENFRLTEDRNNLVNLAACIYRPAGIGPAYQDNDPTYRGDIRQKFNDQLLSPRAKQLANLDKAVIDGIYLFYASCRHQIVALYPEFFPPPAPGEKQAVSKGDFSWFDIYDDLRGDPKFGGPEKLEDEFLHTVLASVERSKKTMKDLKRTNRI